MDLIDTKDIQQQITNLVLRNLARAPSIEKLLGELPNISDKGLLRGLLSEIRVLNFYLDRNHKLIEHRYKGFFAEIDLIFKIDNRRILVEVKTLSRSHFKNHRIGKAQKIRLSREFMNQINKFPELEVEFHYVVASQFGAIEVYDDYFGS